MNHPSARLAALLMTVGLFGVGQTRADYTNWSYQWTSSPNPLAFSSSSTNSGINFSGANTPWTAMTSNTPNGVSPINISTNSSSGTAESFSGANYSLFLTIKDNPSGQTETLKYNGSLTGSVDSKSSTLMDTVSLDPSTPSSFSLGGHSFNVVMTAKPSDFSIGAPGATSTLQPLVTVDAAGTNTGGNGNSGGNTNTGGGVTQTVPEPSALLLAGLACASCGLGGWRRLRQRARLV
jgi:hypothetical protein